MPKEIKRWRKPNSKHRIYIGLFECENCGEQFETRVSQVKRGRKYCLKCSRQLNKTPTSHGMSNTPVFKLWHRLRQHPHSSLFDTIEGFNNWLKNEGWQKGQSVYLKCKDKGFFPENILFGDSFISKLQSASQKAKQINNTSGYVGVSLNKKSGTWRGGAYHNNTKFYMGGFETAYDAARYRDTELDKRNWPNRRSLHSC